MFWVGIVAPQGSGAFQNICPMLRQGTVRSIVFKHELGCMPSVQILVKSQGLIPEI